MIKSIEQLNKETLNKPATLEDIKQRIVDTFNSSHNNCDEDDAEEIVEPSDDEVQVKKPYNPKKDKAIADEQYRIIKESIDNSIKNLQDKNGKINIKELDNIVRIMAHTHIKVLTAGIYPYVTTDLKTKQYFDGYKQGLHTMEKSFTDSVNGNLRKVESAILVEIDRLNMVQNDLIKLREFVLNKFTKLTSIKNTFDQKFDDLNEKAKYLKEQNDQNKSDGDIANIRQKIQSVADELHQDVLRRLQTYVRILDKNVEETINYKINNIMKDKQATA